MPTAKLNTKTTEHNGIIKTSMHAYDYEEYFYIASENRHVKVKKTVVIDLITTLN